MDLGDPLATGNAVTALAAWQRGVPLERLRALTALVKTWDGPHVRGGYTTLRETGVADALADGTCHVVDAAGQPVALVIARRVKIATPLTDFTDQARATLEPGDLRVTRWAAAPGGEDVLHELLADLLGDEPAWLELWEESARDRALARAVGARWVASKILAASEVRGFWARGRLATARPPARERIERLTLAPLRLSLDVTAAAAAVERAALTWADHYSSYNVGHTWTALALRGYGGDPAFIEKPAEMAKAWKAKHPDTLTWALADTPLRAALPEIEPLIAAIPGVKHRIRLMRLAGNGGRLERHADITDPDAGTLPGQTLRIHVPLVTNPGVGFEMWGLRGEHFRAHMGRGEAWYLDDRKPHRAENVGSADRIHLVMDVEANDALLALLGDNPPATWDDPDPDGTPAEVAAVVPPVVLPTPQPGVPQWVVGDSAAVLAEPGPAVDLVFSCPPYGDLERYSDDPRDLSTLAPAAFLAQHAQIIARAVARLKPGGRAVWVVGDYRGADGGYVGFVGETIRAFVAAGCTLLSEAVLVTPMGSLPVRAARQWEASRKAGKSHQQVLVFVKPEAA